MGEFIEQLMAITLLHERFCRALNREMFPKIFTALQEIENERCYCGIEFLCNPIKNNLSA